MKSPRKFVQKKPITIPLSKAQQAQIAELRAQVTAIEQRFHDKVSAITAGHVDLIAMEGWNANVSATAITLTPPPE